MKIGNVEIKNRIFLAPMAGITNYAFRSICHEMGAGLVYAEMVSDKGIKYNNEKTKNMVEVFDNERPIVMQIFGSNPDEITKSAIEMRKLSNFDLLDVNMGCPVTKVIKTGSGSALLKDPENIYNIVKSLKENLDCPVTIKIRVGYDFNSINSVEVAKAAERAGVDAITVHGRTRSQLYSGKANLDYIKQVKEAVKCPVIGNGDICDIESAKHMFEYTGCDAIMIGRGAQGNPWIFRQLSHYFETGEILPEPSTNEVLDMILEHARRLIALKGEHIGIIEMRTHAPSYLRRIPNSKSQRVKCSQVSSHKELEDIIKELR